MKVQDAALKSFVGKNQFINSQEFVSKILESHCCTVLINVLKLFMILLLLT